jgi:hypothetical protein
MSNVVVESLFLVAFFLPPLAVVAGVMLVIIGRPASRRDAAPAQVAHALR